MSDSPERITIGDIRQAGFCVAGAKRWFQAHSLDFGGFLREGILESEFLATGDQLAQDVVDRKRERRTHG